MVYLFVHFKEKTTPNGEQVLSITDVEFERIQGHDWSDKGYVR